MYICALRLLTCRFCPKKVNHVDFPKFHTGDGLSFHYRTSKICTASSAFDAAAYAAVITKGGTEAELNGKKLKGLKVKDIIAKGAPEDEGEEEARAPSNP